MKTDLYTKTILTIISILLLLNLFKPLPLKAYNEQTLNVNIKGINGNSIYGQELPVKIVK